jgi:hypothetical protein
LRDRSYDSGVRVTKDQGAPGIHEIEVGVAISVGDVLRSAASYEARRAAHRTKCAHRGADTAGDDVQGAFVESF